MENSIKQYFQSDSQTLGKLLTQLNQLRQWNDWLKESLEENASLTEHCFIVSLAGTSLIVFADNPHWVTRFRFHIPALLPKLKQYSDFQGIQSICCKVKPNYTPISSLKNRAPQQKLSKQSADLLLETAKKIPDEKLRTVLEKIALHLE